MKYYVGIGINKYPAEFNPLSGCVNDIFDISTYLTAYRGVEKGTHTRLVCDQRATTAQIRERLRWLVNESSVGDTCIINYSGHGTRMPERSYGTEYDGLDEIICPVDFNWERNFISDSELGEVADRIAKNGAVPIFIMDCCHSGTLLKSMPPIDDSILLETYERTIPIPVDIEFRTFKGMKRRTINSEINNNAILITGCKDDEVSADAWFNGRANGAMTRALLNCINEDPELTYDKLQDRLISWMRAGRFEQTPQVTGNSEWMKRRVFE